MKIGPRYWSSSRARNSSKMPATKDEARIATADIVLGVLVYLYSCFGG